MKNYLRVGSIQEMLLDSKEQSAAATLEAVTVEWAAPVAAWGAARYFLPL